MLSLRIFKPGSVMILLAFCSTNQNLRLHSRMTTYVRSVVANVAPVNVSDAKVIEDRASLQLFGVGWSAGRKYTNATTEYHERISLRSTVGYFCSRL